MSVDRRAKRKNRAGGAAMMVWMFFASLFDPKKVVAMEHIDTRRRIGPDAARVAATPSGGLPPESSGATASTFPGEGRGPVPTRS